MPLSTPGEVLSGTNYYSTIAKEILGISEEEWIALLKKYKGLDELDAIIIAFGYAYTLAQSEIGRLKRAHGLIKPKKGKRIVVKNPSPARPLRIFGLRAIGLDLNQINEWSAKVEICGAWIAELTQKHALWNNWAYAVKGLGPILTGLIITAIGDVSRVNSASGLWKSFGLHVDENGKAAKMKKGVAGRVGHPTARMVLGRLRVHFFKLGARLKKINKDPGYYYNLYERSRRKYDERKSDPDWKDEGHRMAAAIRRFQKILLCHAWEVLRKSKGLPAPEPFIISRDPSHGKELPEDAMEEKKKVA